MVAVAFEEAGKSHVYQTNGLEVAVGDQVVAETPRGLELGQVVALAKPGPGDPPADEIPILVRLATRADLRTQFRNRLRAEDAHRTALHKINEHGLPMKLLSTHFTLDGSRIVFFFSAEGRVDFRQLVKDLVAGMRRRIELHQVGARDRAKLSGGIGPCGRECCCTSWLREFAPVSIKMTKEQGLSLNPSKISGACGRLMCCLRYEYETYRKLRAELPKVGATLKIPEGKVTVLEVGLLTRTLTVEHPELGIFDIPAGRAIEGPSEVCQSCTKPVQCNPDQESDE